MRSIYIFAIVVLIVSTLIVYSTFQFTHILSVNMKEQVKPVSLSPIPTGTGKISDPNTWSRYTYQHDFSIAYPPKWNVIVSKDKSAVDFMTNGFHQDDDFTKPYGNSNEITYSIFGENDTSEMSLQNGNQFTTDETSETMVVSNLKHITITGLPAVEYDYYPTDNTHFLRTRISILRNNKMYRFEATYAGDSGKLLFEKVINTIKFK